VIAMTILAFFVAVFWVLVRQGLKRTFELPENRRRLEAIKQYWKAKQDKL
jgi:flagellar biogenesis protein FliO